MLDCPRMTKIDVSLDRAAAIEKLREQRHRLEAALDRLYSHDIPGDRVALEAAELDIATPIRVMMHHVPDRKPPSICLLHQIDRRYWEKPIHFVPLITPKPRILPGGVHAVSVSIPARITIEAGYGPAPTYKFMRYRRGLEGNTRVPLKNWWIDVCWDSGTNEVSNKDLVLAMTNKEGGAHVDGDLTAQYRAAKAQGHLAVGANPISDVARLGSMVALAGDELLEYLDENFRECFQ